MFFPGMSAQKITCITYPASGRAVQKRLGTSGFHNLFFEVCRNGSWKEGVKRYTPSPMMAYLSEDWLTRWLCGATRGAQAFPVK
jgi:hypothetical protein